MDTLAKSFVRGSTKIARDDVENLKVILISFRKQLKLWAWRVKKRARSSYRTLADNKRSDWRQAFEKLPHAGSAYGNAER